MLGDCEAGEPAGSGKLLAGSSQPEGRLKKNSTWYSLERIASSAEGRPVRLKRKDQRQEEKENVLQMRTTQLSPTIAGNARPSSPRLNSAGIINAVEVDDHLQYRIKAFHEFV